jgi:hypothetical protein
MELSACPQSSALITGLTKVCSGLVQWVMYLTYSIGMWFQYGTTKGFGSRKWYYVSPRSIQANTTSKHNFCHMKTNFCFFVFFHAEF